MAQPITAQFITDTGFATGLTPTVTITTVDGTLIGSYPMSETSAGNYIYMFNEYNTDVVYFFNYDGGTDDVINRYQGTNNNTPSVLYSMGGGGTNAKVEDTNKKEKEFIKKIKEELTEEFDKLEEGHKKLLETLGLIVEICKNFNIEFDDSDILSSIEKNTKVIQKYINSIVIPKYNEKIITDKIDTIKIPNYEDKLNGIETKIDKVEKIVSLDTEYEMKKYIKEELELEDKILKEVEDEEILKSLLESDGSD